MNALKVVGVSEKNVKGTMERKTVVFEAKDGLVDCSNSNLITIDVPEGVVNLRCNGNMLTGLKLPMSLKHLDAAQNPLSALDIHVGMEQVSINDTNIHDILLPPTVTLFYAIGSPLETLSGDHSIVRGNKLQIPEFTVVK